jgi:hypothetical protein
MQETPLILLLVVGRDPGQKSASGKWRSLPANGKKSAHIANNVSSEHLVQTQVLYLTQAV